jgi:hypothetical protein
MSSAAIQDLSDPDAQNLLQTSRLARLAYLGRDGLPRVIPIGFHWNGRDVVVCTATIAPKVRALSERPEVAITIDTEDIAPKALFIRGVAAIEVVDGIPDEYLAASAKSMSGEQLREFEQQVRSVYKQMARISITPNWSRFYDFGAGRVPRFLTELP